MEPGVGGPAGVADRWPGGPPGVSLSPALLERCGAAGPEELLQQVLTGSQLHDDEAVVATSESPVALSLFPVDSSNGSVIGVGVTFRDISARVHAEVTLRRLAKAVDASADAIYITTRTARSNTSTPPSPHSPAGSPPRWWGRTPGCSRAAGPAPTPTSVCGRRCVRGGSGTVDWSIPDGWRGRTAAGTSPTTGPRARSRPTSPSRVRCWDMWRCSATSPNWCGRRRAHEPSRWRVGCASMPPQHCRDRPVGRSRPPPAARARR